MKENERENKEVQVFLQPEKIKLERYSGRKRMGKVKDIEGKEMKIKDGK